MESSRVNFTLFVLAFERRSILGWEEEEEGKGEKTKGGREDSE